MSTVALNTPLPKSHSDRPRARPRPLAQPASRARVLVVDDDPSFVALVERYLMLAGYHVDVAADGFDALAILAVTEPQVLLSDIGMPRVDGLDLTRAARARYPNLQVVLMTADPTVKSATSAVELGACRYLAKPFEREDLVLAIERAVIEWGKADERESALGLLRTFEDGQRKTAALRQTYDEVVSNLWMAFQPIVHAGTGGLFGCEALLRSNDPRLPSPPAVLEAAEQLDAIHQLGRSVRARSAAPFVGVDNDTVLFVNLHSRDLLDPELYLRDAPLSRIAGRVVLEITERAPLDNIDDLIGRTTELRAMGFRLAVDDLGAGYAAMWTLAMLEPEVVKLDMSLVRNIHLSRTKSHIVRHLVGMAHDSGSLVVAEGVETELEKVALVDLHCDFLQGYLIGRPVKKMPWE